MAPQYNPITGDMAKGVPDEAHHEQLPCVPAQLDDTTQAEMPVFPSQTPVLPSQVPWNAAADDHTPKPFVGGDFDMMSYANARDFGRPDRGVDHEHEKRVPTGESVIDNAAVFDDSGRSFHGYKQGKYFLPNDGPEQDRLDLQHNMLCMLLGDRLYLAPIQNPQHVLDVATGTGIWVHEFAQQHPNAQVIGTDLSDIQPKSRLPNCSFLLEDSEEDWLFGTTDNPILFDYVHLRYVQTCFAEPKRIMTHAFKNMKPGGWIEYCDTGEQDSIDNNLEGTALLKWWNLFVRGLAMNGRDVNAVRYYKQWLAEVGFIDIKEEIFMCPGNDWPQNPRMKYIGNFSCQATSAVLRGGGWKLLKQLGLTTEEIEELAEQAKRDIANTTYRWFYTVHVVYARKPYEGELSSLV